MNRSSAMILLAATAISLAAAPAARAQAEPQNVILFLADDMDWADLPFYSPSIQWQNAAAPPTNKNDAQVQEGRLRKPDLNRSGARLVAGTPAIAGEGNSSIGIDPIGDVAGAVVPVDRITTAPAPADSAYFIEASNSDGCANPDQTIPSTNCEPRRDILKHHGGLRRLATDGVVMPRMYSTSARCAPARAALITGRAQNRVGVPNNHAWIQARELTIPELLKRGCWNDASTNGYACYRTALVGKWHLGSLDKDSNASPSKQGFDEFIAFGAGSRRYTSSGPLRCSATTVPTPDGGATLLADAIHPKASRFCQLDPDAATTPTCSAPGPCPNHPGLVCGETSGRCFDPKLGVDAGAPLGDGCTYDPDANTCNSLTIGATTYARTCQEHWLYIGREQWDACPSEESKRNLACCTRGAGNPEEFATSGNENGKQTGAYGFKFKRLPDGTPVRFLSDGGASSAYFPCSNDSSVLLDDGAPIFSKDLDGTGPEPEVAVSCQYSERFYRDAAANFIRREAPRIEAAEGSAKERRFFLMVGFHAAHGGHIAPRRTQAHYDTLKESGLAPKEPNDKYWGILEELDAAIGTVLAALDEADEDNPDANLKENTLIIFTNDHGSPSTAYGVPHLKGGKEEVWEGGTRAGMIVYGPSVGACDDGTCDDDSRTPNTEGRARVVAHVGSHVDLLPTIADAAGLDDLLLPASSADGGGLQIKVCEDPSDPRTTIPCTTDQECIDVTDSDTEECKVRGIDGRSLLGSLKDDGVTVANLDDPAWTRDLVFSSFPASGYAGLAMVAKAGAFDAPDRGVCGYERAAGIPGSTASTPLSGRTIQGSTCVPCDFSGTGESGTNADACGGTLNTAPDIAPRCEITGKVCMPKPLDSGSTKLCRDGDRWDSECKLDTLQRCTADEDCLTTEGCVPVKVPCQSNYPGAAQPACFASSWKAMGNAASSNVGISEVSELRTNPEEELDDLDCRSGAFTGLADDLDKQFDCWKRCIDAAVTLNGTAIDADRYSCGQKFDESGSCPFPELP